MGGSTSRLWCRVAILVLVCLIPFLGLVAWEAELSRREARLKPPPLRSSLPLHLRYLHSSAAAHAKQQQQGGSRGATHERARGAAHSPGAAAGAGGHKRHSTNHTAAKQLKPNPTVDSFRSPSGECAELPDSAHLQEEFKIPLFKHGGQVPRGVDIRYAHMATVGYLANGSLVAAWQASNFYEGAEDQRIYTTVSLDGSIGKEWAAPQELRDRPPGKAQWSPALFYDPVTAQTSLFYTQSSHRKCIRPAEGKYPELWPPGGDIREVRIAEGAMHWSRSRKLLTQEDEGFIPKVIANPPIRTSRGVLVLPFWREARTLPLHCTSGASGPIATESAGVLVSKDGGDTWHPQGQITTPGTHLIEGTVAEVEGGCIRMMFRSSTGFLYTTYSCDQGSTWMAATPSSVRNPDAKVHMLGWNPPAGGSWLLAFNNHKGYADVGCRKCRAMMTIGMSRDGGVNWQALTVVEKGRTDFRKAHYPTLLQVGCTRLLIVYSRGYSCCAPANVELGVQLVSYRFTL